MVCTTIPATSICVWGSSEFLQDKGAYITPTNKGEAVSKKIQEKCIFPTLYVSKNFMSTVTFVSIMPVNTKGTLLLTKCHRLVKHFCTTYSWLYENYEHFAFACHKIIILYMRELGGDNLE